MRVEDAPHNLVWHSYHRISTTSKNTRFYNHLYLSRLGRAWPYVLVSGLVLTDLAFFRSRITLGSFASIRGVCDHGVREYRLQRMEANARNLGKHCLVDNSMRTMHRGSAGEQTPSAPLLHTETQAILNDFFRYPQLRLKLLYGERGSGKTWIVQNALEENFVAPDFPYPKYFIDQTDLFGSFLHLTEK